jgi:hypothetical protein
MKTVRYSVTACLAALLLMVLPAALAEEDTATGVIKQVSSDYRGLMINGGYYQLGRNTVVHASVGDSRLSLDALTAGTRIKFRSGRTASGSVVPSIEEIWIYED